MKKTLRKKRRAKRRSFRKTVTPVKYRDNTSFGQYLKAGLGYGAGFELADFLFDGSD